MDIRITPSLLAGTVRPPASKSVLHRAVICGALADGESRITGVTMSRDIQATLECVRRLGAEEYSGGEEIVISGIRERTEHFVPLHCGESGSTLRFMIPIAAALGTPCEFTGEGLLSQRPIGQYPELFSEHGVVLCSTESGRILPLRCEGKLQPGVFSLRGDVSSQFISGLLFALPLLSGDSEIILESKLESVGYVHLTLQALEKAGIQCKTELRGDRYHFNVPGNQKYLAFRMEAEADYSQAAFWLTAKVLGSDLTVEGLLSAEKTGQGDSAICGILQKEGPISVDVSDIPDLVPILSVYAALQPGRSVLYNGSRLRWKESDRLFTTRSALSALGADIREEGDSLLINGKEMLRGGTSQAYNDHRIAMALAIAATRCREPVVVLGAECVRKSYPDFWNVYRMLQGKADVL